VGILRRRDQYRMAFLGSHTVKAIPPAAWISSAGGSSIVADHGLFHQPPPLRTKELRMRTLILSLAILVLGGSANAQNVPQSFTVQGVLRNKDGALQSKMV